MPKAIEVKALENYRLWVRFDDGVEGTVDLSQFVGKGVFRDWVDPQRFASVRVGPNGELAWGDEIDLCPDALYLKVTGEEPEDLLPALKTVPAEDA